MAISKRLSSLNKTRAETGFRSKSEVEVNKRLNNAFKGRVLYEKASLPFSYQVDRLYTPDFLIPEQALVIEVKGMFTSTDRAKMLMIQRQYPDLDIRFVFDHPNTKLSKASSTTYAKWAEKNGFISCSSGAFPPVEWVNHKPSPKQIKAFREAFKRLAQ